MAVRFYRGYLKTMFTDRALASQCSNTRFARIPRMSPIVQGLPSSSRWSPNYVGKAVQENVKLPPPPLRRPMPPSRSAPHLRQHGPLCCERSNSLMILWPALHGYLNLSVFTPRGLNAMQIHPYASLAWSVVSFADQVCLLLDIHTIARR